MNDNDEVTPDGRFLTPREDVVMLAKLIGLPMAFVIVVIILYLAFR